MGKGEPRLRSIVNAISIAKSWILLKLIRLYQITLSPLLGRSCRHHPPCSRYMAQAIVEWGVIRGVWLGLKRIGKCHPWGTFGVDPVPPSPAKRQRPQSDD